MQRYIPFNTIPEILTIKDLMEVLHISRSYALRLVQDKLIPAHKIARQWRILKADLIEYIVNS